VACYSDSFTFHLTTDETISKYTLQYKPNAYVNSEQYGLIAHNCHEMAEAEENYEFFLDVL
jgi:hypothetical protein